MKKLTSIVTAAAATGMALFVPAAAHASTTAPHCTAVRPTSDFYAGGRIATTPITDDNARCRTISVSGIRDVADPADNCQTFLVALLSADGRDPTYTEPVQACSPTPGVRTVLATGVPTGTQYRVLYQVDYIDPQPQQVRFTVWH
ncbi:hypothetical protein [Actinoplanes siamensis]|uniref:Secreted protein n=1 Tax=Actinoplanes siamensis TaxID=1223317 RepID=A0A919TJS9_9ACTN|nr:hypothetical protein [Actinoplanes siamensis]GIF04972.1 hypothetical protein Asi03nite_25100 [Actinoplanes siamensis]